MFSHRGSPNDYLIAAALMARVTNPSSPVFIFHDWDQVPNELSANSVHCIHVREYYGECEKVDQLWFNISNNGSDYERWCMERWMIIRNFMRAHNFSSCFACDSDVLIFSELEKVKHHFKDFDFTVSHLTWGCVFINNIKVLDVFHDLVVELYERNTSFYWRVLDFMGILKPGPKPMHPLADPVIIQIFWGEIAEKLGFRWENTCTIFEDGAFCPDLHNPFIPCEMETELLDPLDTHGPFRKIVWKDGFPFSPLKGSGKLIRMHCLHFQGRAKLLYQVPCFLAFMEHLTYRTNGNVGKLPNPFPLGSFVDSETSRNIVEKQSSL